MLKEKFVYQESCSCRAEQSDVINVGSSHVWLVGEFAPRAKPLQTVH